MAKISYEGINHGLQSGINYGTITANFTAPERQKSSPSPISTVPFSRDPDYVNRGSLLDQIAQTCAVSGSRIALVGLGGVGKSQVVIEYAYRIRETSPRTWVFWVHASNAARFEQSFREIANRVRIPGCRDPTANIYQLVYDWLADEDTERWVMILDNVDDDEFLQNPPHVANTSQSEETNDHVTVSRKPLLTFIPQRSASSVILTTRSKRVARRIVSRNNIFTIKPMDATEAVLLCKKKLRAEANGDGILRLTEALEFMPLAIVQAAAYIENRAPRCSISQYLEDFQKSDRKRIRLLESETGFSLRDWEAKNSILLTWQISFDYIMQVRSSAANLLSLMSFYDRQSIPVRLLLDPSNPDSNQTDQEVPEHACTDSENSSSTESEEHQQFEDDILMLRDFEFVLMNRDPEIFEMHSLVQLATRKWLQTRGQIEKWKAKFIQNLAREFPKGGYENWKEYQLLFPHVKEAVLHRPDLEEVRLDWARLLYSGAYYAFKAGNSVDTERMAVKAMAEMKKLLHPGNRQIIRSMAMVALAYTLRWRWQDAERLQVKVLEMSKREFGEDDPDTIRHMSYLSTTYMRQGRHQDYETLHAQLLEATQRLLSQKHTEMLSSATSSLDTRVYPTRKADAETLEWQVFEINNLVLGKEHPNTLSSMDDLALMYAKQKRWEDAEALEFQLLEIRKRVLGKDHPSTLITMANLTSIYIDQGRWEEAETLGLRAVKMFKQAFHEDHRDTLTAMDNLVLIYENQGRWKHAVALGTHRVEMSQRVLGQEHVETLERMIDLQRYKHQGASSFESRVLLLKLHFYKSENHT